VGNQGISRITNGTCLLGMKIEWKSMEINGNQWTLMDIIGNQWKLMEYIYNYIYVHISPPTVV
jgi:hypothetical protein